MNPGIHEIADVLISSWILSGETLSGEAARIPTSHGLLDRALKHAVERKALPEWAREKLHFVDSRTGLHCVELNSILNMAQRVNLTSAPNPTYRSAEVQVGPAVAEELLEELDIPIDEARNWGVILREEVKRVITEFGSLQEPMLEDY